MPNYHYLVTVTTDTPEHADEVMCGRIGYDEDYGFEYRIDWSVAPINDPEMVRTEACFLDSP